MSKTVNNKQEISTQVDQLKNHVQSFQRHKIDAKSILLMDLQGNVQEPTKQTISLLGTRTQADLRKSQEGLTESQQDTPLTEQDLTGKQIANKRSKGELGQAVEVAQVFKCTFGTCTKEFKSSQYLKTHLAYHQSRANFVCPEPDCQKSFNYRHNLSIHMRVHNDHRPFDCPQKCGKSFRTKGNMMDHLRRHYAIKPYKCDKCDQGFYRNNILKEHMARCEAQGTADSQEKSEDCQSPKNDSTKDNTPMLKRKIQTASRVSLPIFSSSSEYGQTDSGSEEPQSTSPRENQPSSFEQRSQKDQQDASQSPTSRSTAQKETSGREIALPQPFYQQGQQSIPTMVPVMLLPKMMIPYNAQMALPVNFVSNGSALKQPSLSQISQPAGSHLDESHQELFKLGSLFNQMIALQKMLQTIDAIDSHKAQNAFSQPQSEARKRQATLRVPANFNNSRMEERYTNTHMQAGIEDQDFDLRLSNYFNPFNHTEKSL